jgi:hypothetical protein
MALPDVSSCFKKIPALVDMLFVAYSCLVHVCNIHIPVSICLNDTEFE